MNISRFPLPGLGLTYCLVEHTPWPLLRKSQSLSDKQWKVLLKRHCFAWQRLNVWLKNLTQVVAKSNVSGWLRLHLVKEKQSLPSWTIMNHHEPSWTIMNHHEPLGTIVDHHVVNMSKSPLNIPLNHHSSPCSPHVSTPSERPHQAWSCNTSVMPGAPVRPSFAKLRRAFNSNNYGVWCVYIYRYTYYILWLINQLYTIY